MSQPFLSVSAGGLKSAGVTLSAAEAVACVVLVGDFLEWSSDAPDPSGVILRSDGRVDVPQRPAGPQARVETYARLLHRLLPEAAAIAPARVPGALRLAVARGLGVLDAPPFAQPREFRTAIERFLTQRPEDLIVAVLVRWAEAMGSVADERPPERRVSGPRVDVLRRMLREADLERFALLNERAPRASVVAAPAEMRSPSHRPEPIDPMLTARPVLEHLPLPEKPPSSASLFVEAPQPRTRRPLFAFSAAVFVVLLILLGSVARRASDQASMPARSEARSTERDATAVTPDDAPSRSSSDRPTEIQPAIPAADLPPASSQPPAATAGQLGDAEPNGDSSRTMGTMAPSAAPTTSDDPPSRDQSSPSSGFQLANVVDGAHRAENVSLSPDGTRVAFDSDRDGVRGVYIASRDGTGVKRVGGAALTVGPAWAPDSRRLAVLRAEDDMPQVRNLWLLDPESGQERRLTEYRYGEISPASWFPDGRRLCYAQADRLYVMDTQSGASRSFDSPVAGRPIDAVAASPDGRHIVFQVQNDGAWLMNLHDGSVRRVLEDPTVERLAWSPTGRSVAYYSGRAGHWGVWVMVP
jgi:hypothetical protein